LALALPASAGAVDAGGEAEGGPKDVVPFLLDS